MKFLFTTKAKKSGLKILCGMNNCLIDKAVSINLLPFYIFSYVSSVSEMLVDGLLWSDVGQSLLKVVGIGIEIVDKLFAVHGR